MQPMLVKCLYRTQNMLQKGQGKFQHMLWKGLCKPSTMPHAMEGPIKTQHTLKKGLYNTQHMLWKGLDKIYQHMLFLKGMSWDTSLVKS